MKLTDAVTRGRELLEPRQGNDLYAPEEGCERYGGCYRGMALVGAGAVGLPVIDSKYDGEQEDGYDLTDVLTHTWPWASRRIPTLPYACTGDTYSNFSILQAIGHLYDYHVMQGDVFGDPWTFERITDWLRTIEPTDETPQA